MIDAGQLEWASFLLPLVALMAADRLTARAGTAPSLRRAAVMSAAWISVALAFAAGLAWRFGGDTGVTFVTAYALEKSLSVDNLFVFGLIFSQTGIPPDLQRRALFWGVAGALVMRALMIAAGVYLLARFQWVIYPFAALLAYSALRMLRDRQGERLSEATCALCTSWVGRLFPISPSLQGPRFLVRQAGRWMATPLLVAVLALETTDVLFAVDSIPAVFSVTRDPFLVYTSNIYALMGLRSLYFLLSGALRGLRFLRAGLAVMLAFTAIKMLVSHVVDIPPLVSLAVIVAIFTTAIVASWLFVKARTCGHLGALRPVEPRTAGCEECLRSGDSWVSLRLCRTCGHVGCCDSSKNKHARAHFEASDHPIIKSLERGEDWNWCYVDRMNV